jgi:hypothetical protein
MALGFGTSNGGIRRTVQHRVNVQRFRDELGNNTNLTTYGHLVDVSEEFYVSTAFSNTAVNNQSGANVITENSLIEVNTDFQRETITTTGI